MSLSDYLKYMPYNLQMNARYLAKLYEDLFGDKEGTFVEVGAFDGWSWSHTFTLACNNWKGYYVEPHPEYAQQCADKHKDRPKITVEQTAVSSSVGRTKLFVKDATSTITHDESAELHEVPKSDPIIVPTTTMDNLLYKWGDPEIDVMVIDVEGSEVAVLEGFTLEKCLPKLAIVETHELSGWPYRGNDGVNHKSVKCDTWFMGKHSYSKLFADDCNTFCLKG